MGKPIVENGSLRVDSEDPNGVPPVDVLLENVRTADVERGSDGSPYLIVVRSDGSRDVVGIPSGDVESLVSDLRDEGVVSAQADDDDPEDVDPLAEPPNSGDVEQ